MIIAAIIARSSRDHQSIIAEINHVIIGRSSIDRRSIIRIQQKQRQVGGGFDPRGAPKRARLPHKNPAQNIFHFLRTPGRSQKKTPGSFLPRASNVMGSKNNFS